MSYENLIQKNNTGRLSRQEIDQLVAHEIPIDPKVHCFQARLQRQRMRFIAANKLLKKHGYK